MDLRFASGDTSPCFCLCLLISAGGKFKSKMKPLFGPKNLRRESFQNRRNSRAGRNPAGRKPGGEHAGILHQLRSASSRRLLHELRTARTGPVSRPNRPACLCPERPTAVIHLHRRRAVANSAAANPGHIRSPAVIQHSSSGVQRDAAATCARATSSGARSNAIAQPGPTAQPDSNRHTGSAGQIFRRGQGVADHRRNHSFVLSRGL